jgi:hypothetical protein
MLGPRVFASAGKATGLHFAEAPHMRVSLERRPQLQELTDHVDKSQHRQNSDECQDPAGCFLVVVELSVDLSDLLLHLGVVSRHRRRLPEVEHHCLGYATERLSCSLLNALSHKA